MNDIHFYIDILRNIDLFLIDKNINNVEEKRLFVEYFFYGKKLKLKRKIDNLINFMKSESRFQPFVRSIEKVYSKNDQDYFNYSDEFINLAENILGSNAYETMTKGYVSFVMDVNRSQIKYEFNNKYENSTFEDVFKTTYDNKDFMDLYHWGVFASTFLWEHHLEIIKFFRQSFLKLYEKNYPLKCFDLGAGSGVWTWQFLNALPSSKIQAIDISKTSISKLSSMIKSLDKELYIDPIEGDATKWSNNELYNYYDAGISCFLLEHLEKPNLLMENISRLLKKRSYGFICGALTAAEIDHIYEFKRESEIVTLAENAGLRVIEMKSLAPSNVSNDHKYLPRSMAMIVSKRDGDIW